MRTPRGHIRQRGGSYEISVPVGRDPVTQRYRYAYDRADSLEEPERKRATMLKRIEQGREPLNKATVNELLERWLSVAELELSTRVGYEGYIDRVIRPVLGGMRLREVEVRVDILDVLYAELRRCRELCGGRKGLVDHRPLGRARRSGEQGPGHVCGKLCRPHQCQPLEASSIHQIPLDPAPRTYDEVELRTLGNGQYCGRFMMKPGPASRPSLQARVVAVTLADLAGRALYSGETAGFMRH
jgi:integrase